MANTAGELPMHVVVDGRPQRAHSRYHWSGGGLVLTIATVLPDRELAFELISTYTGHRDTDTIATHLVLALGHEGEIASKRHPHERLNPLELARECAYDHATWLIDALADTGRAARLQLDDLTFSELERVE